MVVGSTGRRVVDRKQVVHRFVVHKIVEVVHRVAVDFHKQAVNIQVGFCLSLPFLNLVEKFRLIDLIRVCSRLVTLIGNAGRESSKVVGHFGRKFRKAVGTCLGKNWEKFNQI